MSIGLRFSLLAAVALAAIGQAQTAGAQAAEPSVALPRALEATIAKSHEALQKILNGDP